MYDPNGAFRSGYALYSHPALVQSDESAWHDAAPESNFENLPARYVDLNAPRRAAQAQDELLFPILDSRSVSQVEGFRYDALHGATNERLPMPVQWIYQLQDGTLGSLDAANRFVGSKVPTRDNPIVGRIAFWTDDETNKINLNTASEGTFWDTPRGITHFEKGEIDVNSGVLKRQGLALCQPQQKEFQRYPGHPATVSLSAVFPPLAGETADQLRERTYQIIPRVVGGGSRGGTLKPATNSPALTPDSDRLFTATEELIFHSRHPNGAPTINQRGNNLVFNAQHILSNHAFLTTHSRGPDLNLFGKPRVITWPIHTKTEKRSTYDELAAFAGTYRSGSRLSRYYFQRSNPWDTDGEIDLSVNGEARNRILFNYLANLTSKPIPGFAEGGQTFASKWGIDHHQILAQIYDHIRCLNLKDTSRGYDASRYFSPSGIVVPAKISNSADGFGRFSTISEALLVFFVEKVTPGPESNQETTRMRAALMFETNDPMAGYVTVTNNRNNYLTHEVTGLDTVEITLPNLPVAQPRTNLNFPKGVLENKITRHPNATYHGRGLGGPEGTAHTLYGDPKENYPFITTTAVEFKHLTNNSTNKPTFTLHSFDIKLNIYATSTEHAAPKSLAQTIHLSFPEVTLPVPDNDWMAAVDSLAYKEHTDFQQRINDITLYQSLSGQYKSSPWEAIIQPGDTIISLQPGGRGALKHGDIRLVASQQEVPKGVFQPHARYHSLSFESANNKAHSLRTGTGNAYLGFTSGRVLKNIDAPSNKQLDLPGSVNGVARADGEPGNWDAGISSFIDGAFLGKPDEGNSRFSYTDSSNVFKHIVPYFDANEQFLETGPTHFSPNRQIASPIAFGSLPTGVRSERPWETLLFNPFPAGANHPGAANPPDHLIADFFTMPIIEPYAISEPFSTAGRVNMNYKMLPFPHIHRRTALHSVMKAVRVSAVPHAHSNGSQHYKSGSFSNSNYRYPINVESTLEFFERRFKASNRRT